MNPARVIINAVLSAFLIALIFLLIVTVIAKGFLYPEPYVKIMEDAGTYSAINSSLPGFEFVSIPENNPEILVNGLLENTLSYLRGDSNYLNLTLTINKTRIEDYLGERMDDLEICDKKQLPFLETEIQCRPMYKNKTELAYEILEKKGINITQEKDYNLAQILDKNGNITKTRGYVKNYLIVYYALLVLVLLVAAAIFITNDLESGLRTVGFAIIIAGVVLLVFAAPVKMAASQVEVDSLGIMRGVIAGVLLNISSSVVRYGIFALTAGTSLTIFSFVLRKNKE